MSRLREHTEKELDLYFKAGYQMHPAVYRYLWKAIEAFTKDNGLSGGSAPFVIGWIERLALANDTYLEEQIRAILVAEDQVPEIVNVVKSIDTKQLSAEQKREVLGLFCTLANWHVLTPLQGTEDEWRDMSEYSGEFWLQNIRDSRVFETDRGYWMIGAYYFEDKDGRYFTNSNSSYDIQSFPFFPPKPQYVKYNEHNNR